MRIRALAITAFLCMARGFPDLCAQPSILDAPSITATSKGPDQINLTWPAVSKPGYGYIIEIQSSNDSRYSSWTVSQPIPTAAGYICNQTIVFNGATCTASDPSGEHVYNSTTNGVPYWVTDATYLDPLDGSPAQFIAAGLKPNTSYSFRVMTYQGNNAPVNASSPRTRAKTQAGPYSNVATATTANYGLRYVSPSGNDSNDGTGSDGSHAWRSLAHASSSITCGQALIVLGGHYASDSIAMSQKCSPGKRAVVLVNPGASAIITSGNRQHTVDLKGTYLVVDGIISASSGGTPGEYDGAIYGNHNALLNVEFHPAVVPTFTQQGVIVYGDHNLLYRTYLHDYQSPDAKQNPAGNTGFVLTLIGTAATHNVIWSSHLTRGAHDTSLCKSGCSYNRWLNNVMDGGWGSAWMVIGGAGAAVVTGHNLFEGNVIKDVSRLTADYKPSIEVSYGYNTVRRNVVLNGFTWGLELSALYGGDTAASILVYNNTFYGAGGCIFQSHNGGVSAYDNEVYANNICYKIRTEATSFYLGNTHSLITHNDFLFVDQKGKAQPEHSIIIWNRDAQGAYQYPVPLADADKKYRPPFASNKGLDVNPQFVDEENLDFALSPGSRLIGAGTGIVDPDWGSTVGKVDLGAFGIRNVTIPDKAPPAAK